MLPLNNGKGQGSKSGKDYLCQHQRLQFQSNDNTVTTIISSPKQAIATGGSH